jgi:hypothetical protein
LAGVSGEQFSLLSCRRANAQWHHHFARASLIWGAREDSNRNFTVLRFFPLPGSGQRRSKSLTTAVLLLGGILGAYLTSQLVLQDDRKGLALIALGFAGLAFALKILNNWRQGLYLFFGWLFFEDFARKYLGNNMVIYFAKDFLVILVYLSFWAARRRRKDIATFKPPFLVPLLIMVWFAVGQVFNPGSPSIFYGLLGLKIYFL